MLFSLGGKAMVNSTSEIINIDWKPNKFSKIPIYRQIIDYISNKIFEGHWGVGRKLPSQRELAKLFNVNRSTVAEALNELTSLGIIEGNHGQGTTIINNTWSQFMSTPPPNWQSYIDSGIHIANFPTIQKINKLQYVKDIIRLSTGEMAPDLFPHDMMKKVLQKVPDRAYSLNYLGPLGLFELRQTLSKYLTRYGIDVPPSCILIVSGSLQALQLMSMCMLPVGSTVFVESPSYLKSLHVFQSMGIKLKGLPMDKYGALPWINDKKDDPIDKSLLYTIPTFHNPTGIVMSKERRIEVLDWSKKNRVPIIEDDAYMELWIDETPPMPLKSYDKNGSVIYIGTISKTLAPGLRLGWLVGPESVVERLGDVKMQMDYGASSISQWTLLEWIHSGLYEEHLNTFRYNLKNRRDLALQTLKNYYSDIATWDIPKGGYYIWLKLNKNISIDRLFNLAAREKLLIHLGNIYDFSKNQCIRISYSYASHEDLVTGLKKLSELINKI